MDKKSDKVVDKLPKYETPRLVQTSRLSKLGVRLFMSNIVMKGHLYFLLFSVLCSSINASNILAVWPVLSRSHFSVGVALLERLAENGHTVSKSMHNIDNQPLLKISLSFMLF